MSAATTALYHANDGYKAKRAAYREANRDEIREYDKALYAADREKKKRQSSEWYWSNREAALQSRAEYRELTRDAAAARDEAYRLANPERVLAVKRRYRARTRGAAGSHTGEQIKAMLAQQGYKCVACQRSIRKGYHADHIVPLKLGGSNDISNIQLLCKECNCRKGAKDPIAWARQLGRLL